MLWYKDKQILQKTRIIAERRSAILTLQKLQEVAYKLKNYLLCWQLLLIIATLQGQAREVK